MYLLNNLLFFNDATKKKMSDKKILLKNNKTYEECVKLINTETFL